MSAERKFLCLFCEGECSLEYYKNEAGSDEIYMLLSLWKLCIKHARELDEANASREKKEIEMAVA